jgi:hypothetical protein
MWQGRRGLIGAPRRFHGRSPSFVRHTGGENVLPSGAPPGSQTKRGRGDLPTRLAGVDRRGAELGSWPGWGAALEIGQCWKILVL